MFQLVTIAFCSILLSGNLSRCLKIIGAIDTSSANIGREGRYIVKSFEIWRKEKNGGRISSVFSFPRNLQIFFPFVRQFVGEKCGKRRKGMREGGENKGEKRRETIEGERINFNLYKYT